MLKKLSNAAKKIAKVFDKHIVVPITKVVVKVTDSFDKSSHKLEAILAKQTTLLLLSLVLAITLFIVVDQKILVLTTNTAKVIKDQKAEVLYNDERFVVTGIPESFDVTLIGSKADLYIAEQTSSHNLKIDLRDIKEPGTYKVDVTYEGGSLSSIDYSVNPSTVTVVVYLKESENRSLSYKIVNRDHLDSTVEISNVELNVDSVVISGADYQLEKVASVEALIDVDNLTNLDPGKHELQDVMLKAYDKDGNLVDVEINTKEKVTANVTITSSNVEVNLNFVPVGDVPFGTAISSYSFSQDTVVVYGSDDTLAHLRETGIDIKVDVSKITNNTEIDVEIPKPTGVKKLSTNNVTVDIQITKSSGPVTKKLKIDALNPPEGLQPIVYSADDAEVLVDITGASNILQGLKESEIQAYIDLSNYTKEGTYDVPVQIRPTTSNARLVSYVPRKKTVKIILKKTS